VKTGKVRHPQQQTVPLPLNGDHNNALNPFVLSPPDSLKLWHDARTALARRPQYFYTMMRKYGSINGVLRRAADGVKDEDVGERFPVRMREVILEVEQGVADDAVLRALKDRIKGALVFE
jgi:hypothetical protein